MEAEFTELGRRYPLLVPVLDDCQSCFEMLAERLAADGMLLVCGNGGSAADAEHVVGELMKSFRRPRPLPPALVESLRREFEGDGAYLGARLQRGFRAVALTGHPALSTAVLNDLGGDLVFAQQLVALGRPGDVLMAISTSGNAVNVCHAVRVARAVGVLSIGFCGQHGGCLATLCDRSVCVPETETYRVQELHQPVYHALCLALERRFFP